MKKNIELNLKQTPLFPKHTQWSPLTPVVDPATHETKFAELACHPDQPLLAVHIHSQLFPHPTNPAGQLAIESISVINHRNRSSVYWTPQKRRVMKIVVNRQGQKIAETPVQNPAEARRFREIVHSALSNHPKWREIKPTFDQITQH